jgi:hypothetical protein
VTVDTRTVSHEIADAAHGLLDRGAMAEDIINALIINATIAARMLHCVEFTREAMRRELRQIE